LQHFIKERKCTSKCKALQSGFSAPGLPHFNSNKKRKGIKASMGLGGGRVMKKNNHNKTDENKKQKTHVYKLEK
jgi:hypothetical protein